MAMSKDALAQAMKQEALNAGLESITGSMDVFIDAIAKALVEHVAAHAEVKVTISQAVTQVSGGSGAPAIGVKAAFDETGTIS